MIGVELGTNGIEGFTIKGVVLVVNWEVVGDQKCPKSPTTH